MGLFVELAIRAVENIAKGAYYGAYLSYEAGKRTAEAVKWTAEAAKDVIEAATAS